METLSGSRDDLESNADVSCEELYEDNEDKARNNHARGSITDIANKYTDIQGSDEPGTGNLLYKCEECEASYKSKRGLQYHTSSKHKDICYSCKYCEYKATTQGDLKTHQESIHEGVKYPCDQCDYQATRKGNLVTHKKSVHDGVKYSCNQCDYHATRKDNLITHKKSVHGQKYSCDNCKYQTGWKKQLKKHKDKKHSQHPYPYIGDEIINLDISGCSDELRTGKPNYKCEECEARYTSKRGLYYHTSSKHEGICYSCIFLTKI